MMLCYGWNNHRPHRALWHLPKYWAADLRLDLRKDMKEFKVAWEPWRKWCDSSAFVRITDTVLVAQHTDWLWDNGHVWKAPPAVKGTGQHDKNKWGSLLADTLIRYCEQKKMSDFDFPTRHHNCILAQENMGNVSFSLKAYAYLPKSTQKRKRFYRQEKV